ncbi:MAG: hypothetical protein R2731_11920 [Nocardioides sp.]
MEILFWLVPAAVATLLAMAWAGWRGRGEAAAHDPQRRTGARAAALRRPAARWRARPRRSTPAPRPHEQAPGRGAGGLRRGRRPAPGPAAEAPEPAQPAVPPAARRAS